MAFLRHWVNNCTVSFYELGEAITLGRSRQCHIQLDDGTISSEHFQLKPLGESYEVEDMGSTNGILLNGKKVTSALLNPGDMIAAGTHEFEYLVELPNDLDKTQKIKKSWIPGVYYTE